ncbi:sulfur oxidation c-type cytochrome SoxA [Ectothiorhodospiraceae bacterium 2226]|nr:sulfur oxidation c-type cytochrome SoxA [Ectothiorhodospiraceae bacterium 2226]
MRRSQATRTAPPGRHWLSRHATFIALSALATAAVLLLLAARPAGAEQYPPFMKPGATPEQDVEVIQEYFRNKFPDVPYEDFSNGLYALFPAARAEWEMIEEFPPYDPYIEEGEQLFNTPFANGRSYLDCFGATDVADQYPRWDAERGEVVTLGYAINLCREANGEEPLDAEKGELVSIAAYLAYQVRGRQVNVEVPDDPAALEAYNAGKEYYFSRRGQLNFACYHCHFETAGQSLRTNNLSAALGQTTHMPKYRSKWGEMGSLHRRYRGCHNQVRAAPPAAESETLRNLEYFHTHFSNGLPLNGPGARF